jgi:hypothetical protein
MPSVDGLWPKNRWKSPPSPTTKVLVRRGAATPKPGDFYRTSTGAVDGKTTDGCVRARYVVDTVASVLPDASGTRPGNRGDKDPVSDGQPRRHCPDLHLETGAGQSSVVPSLGVAERG